MKHFNILLKAGWSGRREYFKFYDEFFRKELSQGISRFFRRETTDESALPPRLKKLEESYRKLSDAYEPKPYPGKVIMFKALRGNPAGDPANGWNPENFGAFTIHSLDCYHGSILFDPAVTQMSRVLMKYMEELNAKDR